MLRDGLLVGLALLVPVVLSAQGAPAAVGLRLTAGDACQLIGGAVTLGFGVWHFAVPELYGWKSYVPEAPESLVRAVEATNFFLSLSLSLVGATSVAMPFLSTPDDPATRAWLWTNVGLWTARAVYQLVRPQGEHSPALRWGMLAAFVVTDGLFLYSALEATL